MRKSQGVFVSECSDEYLPRLACPRKVKRTKGRKYMSSYLDVTATFDIETTNTDTDGFAYSWQTCIGGEVIVPRYFEDWAEMLETLVDKWGINEKNRFVLYVHNLGYEHQYKEHKAGPEATKVARHQPGKDVERGTTLAGGVHHFVHVCRGG